MARDRKPHDPAAEMARIMTERCAADDACTEEHLFAAGFTRVEIEIYGEEARAMCRAAETRIAA